MALTALNYAVEPKNNKQPEKNANNSSAPVTSASSQKSTLYGDSLDIVVCQNQMISNLAKIEANKRNLNCELVLANVYEVDIETQGSGAQLFFDFKNRTLYYNDKANHEQFLRLINYFESPNNKTGGQVAISFSNEKKSYLPWQKLDSITVQKNPDGKKFLRLEGLNFYKVFADYANPLNKHFRLRITSQNFNQPTEWRGFSINTHYNPSQKNIF